MSGTSRPGKDVFECGFPHEVGMALGRAQNPPTRQELQRIIIDPLVRDAVVAAVRGTPVFADPRMTADQLLGREMRTWEYAKGLVDGFRDTGNLSLKVLPEFPVVEEAVVAKALKGKQEATGELTLWDYFQPQGLEIPHGLALLASLGIHLWQAFGKENWRTWQCVDFLPTKAGIMTCEFTRVGSFWDTRLRPFGLDFLGQIAWAKEVGGDTIHSVEEALSRNFRGQLMLGYPVGINRSERCRNAYGSTYSLSVDCDVDDGLDVEVWDRDDQDGNIGAFARKFVALGR